MLSKYRTDTQQVLDNLYNEHLIPFKLVAHNVTQEGSREFRISFYDSRLHSVVVEAGQAAPIADQVRVAVLGRLAGRRDPGELGVSSVLARRSPRAGPATIRITACPASTMPT